MMKYQYLRSFLNNIDDFVSFAIFGTDGDFISSENNGKCEHSLSTYDTFHKALKRTITCKLPVFSLSVEGEFFHCVKTGNKGFVGKNQKGETLIAKKSTSASVIFIGEANNKRPYLCNVTRALEFHEQLNNGHIDNLNHGINTIDTNRNILKG